VAPKRNGPANEHLLCSRRLSNPSESPPRNSPAITCPTTTTINHQTMELFPDGAFVRLQSRARRTYVHADGDWAGVSLRPNGPVPPLNAVWRVEHLVWSDQGDTFVLLQNAAYGRYLSFSIQEAPPGHRGRCTTQLDRNEPHALSPSSPWMWRVQRLDPPDHGYVRLRYFGCDLRANGRHRTWNTCVTVDVNRGRRVSTMMQWTAHVVAASSVPPPLPASPQPQVRGGCAPFFLLPCIALDGNSPRRPALLGTPIIDASVFILSV
jgi:hypothetical protein